MSNPAAPLFKASVTLPKAHAPNVVALLELAPPVPQAVLTAEDPFGPEAIVEALYAAPPDAEFLTRLTGCPVSVEPLPDQDWIKASEQGLPPVRAGRFFLYGAHDRGLVPAGVIPICIEAGPAFGTGHHESTALCLRALSDHARRRRRALHGILDLGCGTGVLSLAVAKLWHVPVTAADIDPNAIATVRANARVNGVGPLVRSVLADGLEAPALRRRFALILANILAGPLTRLAPGIVRALAPGGTVVLSGLLRGQEELVLSFYRALGLRLVARRRDGPWSALVLERPRGRD